MASLLSDIVGVPGPGSGAQQSHSDAMVAFAVGRPYLPCTFLLQDLQLVNLSDLRIETHHRGLALTLRRVAPVVKLVAYSWTVMEEESSGETERFEMFLHKSSHGKEFLEMGSTFLIKEPYFTLNDQGDPTLRVDHPSDLVCMDSSHNNIAHHPDEEFDDSGDTTLPTVPTAPPVPPAKTARKYKEEGNAALKQKELLRAHAFYTQGLLQTRKDAETDRDLICDLHRNRAHVDLLLNRFDEAEADAMASVTGMEDEMHKILDSKAYYRAGCAARSLGNFEEAKRFFEEQQNFTPDDKSATANLRKIEMRLQEQATGLYDWKRIKASLFTTGPRVDAASFTKNIVVKESPGRGRGLFATRNIDSGDLVFCEKSFCCVWGHGDEAWTAMTYDIRDDKIRGFPAGLCRAIVHKLLNNPSQHEKVMDLYGDYKGTGKQSAANNDGPIVNTFQVHDIVARNAFGPGPVYSGGHHRDEDVSNASTGLWILASYTNHSCVPNSKKEYVGDLMILRATRSIRVGEEITHSYDESSDYEVRTAALMNTWGFTCTCALCIAEKTDEPVVRKKRQELERDAIALLEKDQGSKAKRLSIYKAQRLARSISDTYDDRKYSGLPHAILLRLEEWLAEATTR